MGDFYARHHGEAWGSCGPVLPGTSLEGFAVRCFDWLDEIDGWSGMSAHERLAMASSEIGRDILVGMEAERLRLSVAFKAGRPTFLTPMEAGLLNVPVEGGAAQGAAGEALLSDLDEDLLRWMEATSRSANPCAFPNPTLLRHCFPSSRGPGFLDRAVALEWRIVGMAEERERTLSLLESAFEGWAAQGRQEGWFVPEIGPSAARLAEDAAERFFESSAAADADASFLSRALSLAAEVGSDESLSRLGARCGRRLEACRDAPPDLASSVRRCLERIERVRRLREPRRLLIVAPRDAASLEAEGGAPALGSGRGIFLCAPVFLQPDSCFVALPEPRSVVETSDPGEILSLVGDSACLLFDQGSFDELDALFAVSGRSLPVGFVEFLARRAADTHLSSLESLFEFGFQGGAGLDLPENGEVPPSDFAMRWLVEALNFVLGIEEQRRLFER